jgi:2-amino-4-hydroxy-6-hydroxymethyldihydropteridine diphosphokinase
VGTAYVGIGSNVGDRQSFCRRAVEALGATADVSITKASSLYETSPVGPPQRSFINLVVEVETILEPRSLLEVCKEIETRLGREPSAMRWGPRVIDLDLLTYDEEKINEPDLEIPHPGITSRKFVLIPLLEVNPDASDPWGMRYADYVDEAEGEVELIEPY